MSSRTSPVLWTTWLGQVPYEEAWAWQRALLEARASGRVGEHLLLLEHPPVITLGRRGREEHVLAPRDDAGRPVPVLRVDRGGDVTWHGPGQLVGYPVVSLDVCAGGDVIGYLRSLEHALVAACAEWGVEARRREGYTGVWVGDAKLASIGVGVRRGVTQHGFALNVAPDLRWFDRIVPCGLHGVQMTSLAALGVDLTLADAAAAVARHLARTWGLAVEPAAWPPPADLVAPPAHPRTGEPHGA